MAVTVSYERICGTVASLLLLFARIENEAREIIEKAGRTDRLKKVRGARGALREWRDSILEKQESRPYEAQLADALWGQAQGPLDVRNGVCHGLCGATASLGDTEANLTWWVHGGTQSMTYSELQEVFAWLSKIPQAMPMISHAACVQDASKLRPLPALDFWATEFGIKFD
ncbi:MAG: hypothetical protein ACK4IU_11805 [Tabrizicola flagellatus]|uniref:hypothetical protein n=1 Tax=Tabrizicola flagellatus TaxID=2593021 RepID=UPI00391C136E